MDSARRPKACSCGTRTLATALWPTFPTEERQPSRSPRHPLLFGRGLMRGMSPENALPIFSATKGIKPPRMAKFLRLKTVCGLTKPSLKHDRGDAVPLSRRFSQNELQGGTTADQCSNHSIQISDELAGGLKAKYLQGLGDEREPRDITASLAYAYARSGKP